MERYFQPTVRFTPPLGIVRGNDQAGTAYQYVPFMPFPRQRYPLPLLPFIPFQFSDLTIQQMENNFKAVAITPPKQEHGNETFTKLKIWGHSKTEFVKILQDFCKNIQTTADSEWSSSMAASDVCNKLFLDNEKLVYVLMSNYENSLVPKPDISAFPGNDGNIQETGKILMEGDEFALTCVTTIGSEKYVVFLFTPMDQSFMVTISGVPMASLYYHGNATERVHVDGGHGYKYDPTQNWPKKIIQITFHSDD